jgi:hypothetical protein
MEHDGNCERNRIHKLLVSRLELDSDDGDSLWMDEGMDGGLCYCKDRARVGSEPSAVEKRARFKRIEQVWKVRKKSRVAEALGLGNKLTMPVSEKKFMGTVIEVDFRNRKKL